jgi:hypothetical protein
MRTALLAVTHLDRMRCPSLERSKLVGKRTTLYPDARGGVSCGRISLCFPAWDLRCIKYKDNARC